MIIPDINVDVNSYVPFLTTLVLYSIIGTTGNILILVVYFRERVKLSHVLFIRVLSVVDLTVCAVIIPYTIALEMHVIKIDFICRFIEVVRHVLVLYSNSILSAIALERYFAVCRPMKKLTYRQLKVIVAVLLMFSIVLSLPAAVVFKVCRFTECHSNISELIGGEVNNSLKFEMYCQFSTLAFGYWGTCIYQLFQCGYFFLAVLSFLVIYPLVYRVIVKRSIWRRSQVNAINLGKPAKSVSSVSMPSKSIAKTGPSERTRSPLFTINIDNAKTSNHLQVTPAFNHLQVTPASNILQVTTASKSIQGSPIRSHLHVTGTSSHQATPKTNSFKGTVSSKTNISPNRRKVQTKRQNGGRTGTMLFVCTLVFVLVWMPFWIDVFTSVENLTFRYLFLIGHVTNPLIYGIMSKEVRREIYSLFCCKAG